MGVSIWVGDGVNLDGVGVSEIVTVGLGVEVGDLVRVAVGLGAEVEVGVLVGISGTLTTMT